MDLSSFLFFSSIKKGGIYLPLIFFLRGFPKLIGFFFFKKKSFQKKL